MSSEVIAASKPEIILVFILVVFFSVIRIIRVISSRRLRRGPDPQVIEAFRQHLANAGPACTCAINPSQCPHHQMEHFESERIPDVKD